MNDFVKNKHGGKRSGAGRKPGSTKNPEKSVVVRIPESQKAAILNFIAFKSKINVPGKTTTGQIIVAYDDKAPWSRPSPPPKAISVRPNHDALKIPVFDGKVNAGQSRFASAAQDYEMKDLDLNELLVTDPPATFIVQLDRDADSMIDAGIFPGSWIMVNKAQAPKAKSKDIVLAIVNDEYVVKRLYKRGNVVRLLSENKVKNYPPIEFSEGQELLIWGVVEHVITSLK